MEAVNTVEGSDFSIKRTVTADKNSTSRYEINNVKTTKEKVDDLLRKKGIDLDHNRFLIL